MGQDDGPRVAAEWAMADWLGLGKDRREPTDGVLARRLQEGRPLGARVLCRAHRWVRPAGRERLICKRCGLSTPQWMA